MRRRIDGGTGIARRERLARLRCRCERRATRPHRQALPNALLPTFQLRPKQSADLVRYLLMTRQEARVLRGLPQPRGELFRRGAPDIAVERDR